MIYELRIYHAHAGKLSALHHRFESTTLTLFQKHGIDVVDFWTDAEGHERLYYVLAYPDMDAKQVRWDAFLNDAEWIEVKTASEVDGPLVIKVDAYVMTRVPYLSK